MGSTELLFGHDDQIAQWAFTEFGFRPVGYDMAVGILRGERVVGAAIYHAWNGPDVEMSYYGPNTMTLGVVRKLAKVAVEGLGVSRITVRTARNNKTMTRGIKGLGFEFEGVRHHAYGKYDALMYGLYGKKLARLAGMH